MNKSKLRNLKVNQSLTIENANINELNKVVNEFVSANRAYSFNVRKQKNQVVLTRVVPTSIEGKSSYISTISKTQLSTALKKYKTSKVINAAKELFISERSVYRLIKKLNISVN